MILTFAVIAILLSAALALATTVQTAYLESLRLRGREFPSLTYFKEHLQDRIGLETERGMLVFSLAKHSLIVLIGVVIALAALHGRQPSPRPIAEACVGSLLMVAAAAYIIPQVLYRRTEYQWMRPLTPLLRIVGAIARPAVAVLEFFQSVVEISEPEREDEEEPTAAENIDALISAGAEEGIIQESDRELIQSVVAFGDKTVREVMTPRPNIVAISADESLEVLRDLVINEQYSRIPVYEDSIDHVIGFVHVRDMFELEEEQRRRMKVRELMRTVRFVPETKPVHVLIREMQQDRAHMAIVVDEYGNTAGLVTLEDLVEEVFGEIRDEHEPGLDVATDGNGGYIVSGNFGVDRLEELVDFRPPEDTESTTVGGLAMEWLGRVPQPGESVERHGLRIDVLSSNELRVEQVRVARVQNSTYHAI